MKIFKCKNDAVEHTESSKVRYTKAQEFMLERLKYENVYKNRPILKIGNVEFCVSDEGGLYVNQRVLLDVNDTKKLALWILETF